MSEKLCALKKIGGGNNGRFDSGTITASTSSTKKITLGYKPSFVMQEMYNGTGKNYTNVYFEDVSSVYQICANRVSTTKDITTQNMPISSDNMIASIDNDGFTLNKYSSAYITNFGSTVHWCAGK